MPPTSFNEIPSGVKVPFVAVEFDTTRAEQGPSIQPYIGLVIGQKTSGGTQAPLVPFLATSAEQVRTAAGAGSIAHNMAQRIFENDLTLAWWFVLLDDAGGSTAATIPITVTGTQTEAGTVSLMVAGRHFDIGVAVGDTNDTVAAAIAAALTASLDAPVTAAAVTNVATLTARNKGTMGSSIDVRLNYFAGEKLPAGLVVTIGAVVAGATDPVLTGVWPVLDATLQYNVWAVGLNGSAALSALATQLEERAGPLVNLQAMAFVAKDDTHGNLITLGNGRNSRYVSIMGFENSPSPSWEWAAAYAAEVGAAARIDPARPFTTLPLVGILPPLGPDLFGLTERNLLLNDGISTFTAHAGVVRIERAITTFQISAAGAPSTAYLDVTTVFTLDYLRFDIRTQTLNTYPRHKLGNDVTKGIPAGQAMVTPSTFKLFLIGLARGWQELGLVEGLEQFKRDLIVERNLTDPNRLDVQMAPDLVNQFLILGVQVQFLLQSQESLAA